MPNATFTQSVSTADVNVELVTLALDTNALKVRLYSVVEDHNLDAVDLDEATLFLCSNNCCVFM